MVLQKEHHLGRRTAIFAALIASISAAAGQSTKAELLGVITDPAGLPIQSAKVELANVATDVMSPTATGAKGDYHFFALLAGSYRMTVTKDGFATLKRDGIVLRVGDQINLDLSLQIGKLAEALEV